MKPASGSQFDAWFKHVRQSRTWRWFARHTVGRSVAALVSRLSGKRPNAPHSVYWELNVACQSIAADLGVDQRNNYTWGLVHSAHLARALDVKRITAIELGVAGGNGLLAMERASKKVAKRFGVGIDVFGFDTGTGLPKPKDYRDLPNLFSEGHYRMDQDELKRQLDDAQLILGELEKTIPAFLRTAPAPVGFVSVDVDYCSSTIQPFPLFAAEPALLLPRVHCYFDDILGFTFADHNGQRLAIHEFNQQHPMRRFSPIYGLRYLVPLTMANEGWVEQFYLLHALDHKDYGKPDGLVQNPRLDLRSRS